MTTLKRNRNSIACFRWLMPMVAIAIWHGTQEQSAIAIKKF